jgi:hypothetical protein
MTGPEMKELGIVRIASPCPMKWSQMSGDDTVRFCSRCEQNVFNLSGLTSNEARALLNEKQGRLCVRFWARADGTVVTRDCPLGVRLRRYRWFAAMAAVVSASITFASWLVGREPELRPVKSQCLVHATGGCRYRLNNSEY